MRLAHRLTKIIASYVTESKPSAWLVNQLAEALSSSLRDLAAAERENPSHLHAIDGGPRPELSLRKELGRHALGEIEEALRVMAEGEAPVGQLSALDAVVKILSTPLDLDQLRTVSLRAQIAGVLGNRRDRVSLNVAASIFADARPSACPGHSVCLDVLMGEASARQGIADLRGEPASNWAEALALYEKAREHAAAHGYDEFAPLLGVAEARLRLGILGMRPAEHLREAAVTYRRLRESGSAEGSSLLRISIGEAEARTHLVELGLSPEETTDDLASHLALCEKAQAGMEHSDPDFARVVLLEARVRLRLAMRRISPSMQLSKMIEACERIESDLDVVSLYRAKAVMLRGLAWTALSEIKAEPDPYRVLTLKLLDFASTAFVTGSVEWAEARRTEARVLRRLGNDEVAYRKLEEGLAAVEAERAQMRNENERIAFFETLASHYQAMVQLCLDLSARSPTAEEEERWRWTAWNWSHRGKSRALLELFGNARPRLSAEQLPLYQEWEELSKTLDEQEREVLRLRRLLAPADRGGPLPASPEPNRAAWLNELERWEERRIETRKAYARKREEVIERVEGLRDLRTVEVPSPKEARLRLRALASLPARTEARPLHVEYQFAPDDRITVFLTPLWREDPPMAISIATPPGAARKMAESLQRLTGDLRPLTRARRSGAMRSLPAEARDRACRKFADLQSEMGILFDPWSSYLEGWRPTEIVLSPHSLLNLLPLHAALREGIPLIERFPVAYLPSPSLAGEIARKRRPFRPEALLIGNPTRDLEGSEEEVRIVAGILEDGGIRTDALLGAEATADQVRTRSPSAGIAHFACHAFLDADDFPRSGIELADRRLTAFDVTARGDFSQASLVYLSSCESGKALPGRTDELMALLRAFLYAGSPSVIASLWDVRDDAGRDFAALFYHQWLAGGRTLAEALQGAVREMRELGYGAIDWAPFILMGAWNTKGEVRARPQAVGL